jgi:very-short-patch-repair endonuclease
MPVDAFVIQRLCNDLGGVASTREFGSAGVDAYSLELAVRGGALERLREGVYASADAPEAVRVAVRHGGVLGCLSRVREEGLWVLVDEPSVHVAMPQNGRRRPHTDCTCVIHWSRSVSRGGRASLLDAIAQLLGCRGEEEFFVALESAMRKRRFTRADLARLESVVMVKHRWLVRFARWDADSGLESLLRLRLHRIGFSLHSQVRVPGVGIVDFVLGDRLILEVDGKPNHAGAPERHKDLMRDVVAAAHGFDTLRFDYAMVVHDWPVVEAAILAKVERGLHLGSRVAGRSR